MVWIIVIASIFVAVGMACKKALRGFESTAAVEMEKEEEQVEDTVDYVIPALIELDEKEAAKKAKHDAELEQAEIDADFLRSQIASYEEMRINTKRSYKTAVAACEFDELQSSVSASAVKQRDIQKHILERDRLHKQLLKTETILHNLEKRLAKAEFIISRG